MSAILRWAWHKGCGRRVSSPVSKKVVEETIGTDHCISTRIERPSHETVLPIWASSTAIPGLDERIPT